MRRKFNNKGIGLIILTAVVLALGLIVAVLLEYVNIDLSLGKNKKTVDKIEEIRKAVKKFTKVNGRFPCPASFKDIPTSEDFGLEQRDDDNEICYGSASDDGIIINSTDGTYYGTVPVRTLGLPDDYMVDKWNNKMGFIIPSEFVSDNAMNQIFAQSPSEGSLKIDTDSDNSADISTGVYAVISYGREAKGAVALESAFEPDTTLINDGFEFVANTGDDLIGYETLETFAETEVEELEYCEASSNVTIEIFESDGTTATAVSDNDEMSFPEAKFGATVYSNENCPKQVSSPVDASDYYYIAYEDENATVFAAQDRIGRVCGKNGVWESGFINVCKALPKCDGTSVLISTIDGRTVTWDTSETNIVHNGVVVGTFDDNGVDFELRCDAIQDKFYVVGGEDELKISCSVDTNSTDANATWDEATVLEGETVTATGCQTGYNENASGLATMTCTPTGWGSITNVCNKACEPSEMSNYGYATWDETTTYSLNDVAIATGCQTGYNENASGLATMTCGESGWESVTNSCVKACDPSEMSNYGYATWDDAI
jgi:hypothetical protein